MKNINHDTKSELASIASKVGADTSIRHVFLCIGPNCCSEEEGLAAWEELKKQIKEKKLDQGEATCFRTKVGCLRVCKEGPIATVYPEGTWYCGLNRENISRFVESHLAQGAPVQELVFTVHPLPPQESNSSARDS